MSILLWRPKRSGFRVIVEERSYSSFLGVTIESRTGRYFTVGFFGWAKIWMLCKLSRSQFAWLRSFAEQTRLRTQVTYTYYQDQAVPDFSTFPAGRN